MAPAWLLKTSCFNSHSILITSCHANGSSVIDHWSHHYCVMKYETFWWQWCWLHRYVGDFMIVTDMRCWWQNHYVIDFFRYVGDSLNVLNLARMWAQRSRGSKERKVPYFRRTTFSTRYESYRATTFTDTEYGLGVMALETGREWQQVDWYSESGSQIGFLI